MVDRVFSKVDGLAQPPNTWQGQGQRDVFGTLQAPSTPRSGKNTTNSSSLPRDTDADATASPRQPGSALVTKQSISASMTAGDANSTRKTRKRKRGAEDDRPIPTTPIKPGRNGKMARKECIICCVDVPVNQYPKLPHETADTHDRGVCLKCWELHLVSQVSSKGWDAVSCPQCTEVLSEAEIRKIASGKTYEAWLDKAAKACGESSEEYRPCPRAECDWACFLSTKEDGNIFTCRKCKYRHCVLCEVAMHDEETCAKYQARVSDEATREQRMKEQAEENEASEKMVDKISKACPQCGRRLDKYIGCDHVTCTSCKHEFCWQCFAPYAGSSGIRQIGNRAHATPCRHYA